MVEAYINFGFSEYPSTMKQQQLIFFVSLLALSSLASARFLVQTKQRCFHGTCFSPRFELLDIAEKKMKVDDMEVKIYHLFNLL